MSASIILPGRTGLRRGVASILPRAAFSTSTSASASSSSAPSSEESSSSSSSSLAPSSSSSPAPQPRGATRSAGPKIEYAKTNWSSAPFLDPAPPGKHSHLTPPLPNSSFASSIKSVAIGPSSSNATSLKHAERSLHLKLRRKGGGHQIGPEGMVRGVQFVTGEKARGINARAAGGQAEEEESLSAMSKRQRQQAYLEREGGDYSRFLPPSAQQQKTGGEDAAQAELQRIASHALSGNTTVSPEARDSLTRQVGELLKGKPFPGNQGSLAKVGPAKVEAPPVPQAAAAPAKKKGKK